MKPIKADIPGFKARYLYVQGEGNFFYRRIIPKRYRELAGRDQFKEALRTKDPAIAKLRYVELNDKYELMLQRLHDGKSPDEPFIFGLSRLRAAAAQHQIPYRSAAELIQASDEADFDQRLNAFERASDKGLALQAFFGAQTNETCLSEILTFYEEQTQDQLIGLNTREVGRKRQPVQLAMRRLIDFLGDIPVSKLSKPLASSYLSHLMKEVQANPKFKAETANKQLVHVRKVISLFNERNGFDLPNPFSKLRLKTRDKGKRPAYSIKYLKDRWFSSDVFATLNSEARAILFLAVDTGCGGKELAGMLPSDIHLEGEIPYIKIFDNEVRHLKTDHRGRDIPLVGHALEAIKQFPAGFPKYRTDAGYDNFSATVMKYLKGHKLQETDLHGIYSLRHTFMDRMRIHSFPDELLSYFMGHKHPTMGAHYGKGYDLKTKHFWMKKLEDDWA